MEFTNNPINDHNFFNWQNLFMCRYLSLRGSSFVNFQVEHFFSLEYFDIRETQIADISVINCYRLKEIIVDSHQVI